MSLIDVDVAKKAVHEEFDECLVWDESGERTANEIEEILEALPTVDAVPVRHGKWIPYKAYFGKHKDSWVDEVRCSKCGYAFGEPEWKYCPECGARMDAERGKE